MAFDPDFLSLMGSLITYKAYSTPDGYGGPGFGTPLASIPARVVYKTRIIRTDTEDRILSTATVYLPPGGYVAGAVTVPHVSDEDQIQLPDDSIWRHILLVTTPTDETGDFYQELALT